VGVDPGRVPRPTMSKDARRVVGNTRLVRETLQVEHDLYASCFAAEATRKGIHSRFDLLGGMAGDAHCTRTALRLTAFQPCDYRYDRNLHTRDGCAAWKECIMMHNPLCVIMALNCTEWCWYNVAINYKGRPEELRTRQDAEVPIIMLCVWTARCQARHDRIFVIENPFHSALFKHPSFEPIWNITGCQIGLAHMCAHGAFGHAGCPLSKTMRFISNSAKILHAIWPSVQPRTPSREDRGQEHPHLPDVHAHLFSQALPSTVQRGAGARQASLRVCHGVRTIQTRAELPRRRMVTACRSEGRRLLLR